MLKKSFPKNIKNEVQTIIKSVSLKPAKFMLL